MEIKLEDIKAFSKQYNEDLNNKIIEDAIVKNGVKKVCIKKNVIIKNQPVFNIELPESKRYNQKESAKCWIYAGINTIKYNMAKNLNIDLMKFELSSNYIAFFDKLEKANNTYGNIINLPNDTNIDFIIKEKILDFCVNEGGWWQTFVSIINKYGILPESYMPNPIEGENKVEIDKIYNEKVKKDVTYLLQAKKENKNIEYIKNMQKQFIQENYNMLSKILGEPPTEFLYEYRDKDDKYINKGKISPLEFKEKYLTINLNDFISIGNVPMYNKEYNKLYLKKYVGTFNNSKISFLNLEINEIKDLVIKQLKDETPVWMACSIMKYRDVKSGVLDYDLYDYEKILGLKKLTKEEALNFSDIECHHAMTFVGVNVNNNKPERWKIEDSYGIEQKVNGCYIMNDNYFDEYIFNVIINKKYLSNEQLELLKQKPVIYDKEENI